MQSLVEQEKAMQNVIALLIDQNDKFELGLTSLSTKSNSEFFHVELEVVDAALWTTKQVLNFLCANKTLYMVAVQPIFSTQFRERYRILFVIRLFHSTKK